MRAPSRMAGAEQSGATDSCASRSSAEACQTHAGTRSVWISIGTNGVVRCNTGSLGTPRDRLQSDKADQHESRSYGDEHAPTHPLHAYKCKCSGSFGNYSSVVCRVCLSVSPGARALSLSLSLLLSLSLCAGTSVFLKARVCACVCVGGGLVTSLLLLYVDTLDAFIRRRRVNDCTHRSTHARRHNTSDTVIPPHICTQDT